MSCALLLIDVQNDFLARAGLSPAPPTLVGRIRLLLDGARGLGIRVMHCHTRVAKDGSDRMPHWKVSGLAECVAGSEGAKSPAGLTPRTGEPVFFKRFFSAFGDPALETALREDGIETVVLAGNFVHGCVRATALDAYERGFEIWIADDAVGTTEPDHAELTRMYLEGRAARWAPTAVILERLGGAPTSSLCQRRDPRAWHRIAREFPMAGEVEVATACTTAGRAHGDLAPEYLRSCAELLEQRVEPLARLVALEVGKPIRYARAEVRAAAAHVRFAAGLELEAQLRPHGVVALITPWNNPIAIPMGKIAPALRLGNAVVWKAACEAPRTAQAVLDLLREAGAPERAVQLLLGGSAAARALIDREEIAAVSLTGSIATGRAVAVRCLRGGKPLQAELGGNNATIVLEDFDFDAAALDLARDAFACAGQRCTAARRFLVDESIAARFEDAIVAATRSLATGDPLNETTEVGPLVSRVHRDAIIASLDGADVICGGTIPDDVECGCWLTPALVRGAASDSRLAQEESFGPVALILPVRGFDHALAVANGVEHGLAATLLTNRADLRARFADEVQAGIVKYTPGPLAIDAAAPFGGWKASGLGPPEHGRWDREFYSRPQARYGGP